MDVSVDCGSSIMEMICMFTASRNERLTLGSHLISAGGTSMVRSNNTTVADADLHTKHLQSEIMISKIHPKNQCFQVIPALHRSQRAVGWDGVSEQCPQTLQAEAISGVQYLCTNMRIKTQRQLIKTLDEKK